MPEHPEFTPDQIVDGIHAALKNRDLDVIPDLIKLLAAQDPHHAQDVLDTIDLGLLAGRLTPVHEDVVSGD